MNLSFDNFEKLAAMLLSFAFMGAGFFYKVSAPENPDKYERYNQAGTEFLNTGLSMGFGTGLSTAALSRIASLVNGKKKDEDGDSDTNLV